MVNMMRQPRSKGITYGMAVAQPRAPHRNIGGTDVLETELVEKTPIGYDMDVLSKLYREREMLEREMKWHVSNNEPGKSGDQWHATLNLILNKVDAVDSSIEFLMESVEDETEVEDYHGS